MIKKWFIVCLVALSLFSCSCSPTSNELLSKSATVRAKRQFSMNLGATHQEGEGTDVTLDAIARLWRSKSGQTEVQGSASYNQHFGGYQGDGKAKISTMLTLTHNY